MNATPPLVRPAVRRPAPKWRLAPALFTVAAVLGGVWGYRSSPIIHGTPWLTLPYVVPLALVAASWRPPTSPGAQTRAMVLGGAGVLAALVYAHVATFVLYTAALLLWAFQGGG